MLLLVWNQQELNTIYLTLIIIHFCLLVMHQIEGINALDMISVIFRPKVSIYDIILLNLFLEKGIYDIIFFFLFPFESFLKEAYNKYMFRISRIKLNMALLPCEGTTDLSSLL